MTAKQFSTTPIQAHDANGELLFTSTPLVSTAGTLRLKTNKAGGATASQKITESGQLTTESWQGILQRACADDIVISPFAHRNLQQTTLQASAKKANSSASAPITGSAKLISKAQVDVFTLNPHSVKESVSPSHRNMSMAYKSTPITVRYTYKETM